jgi:hypothetical protein
MTVGFAAGVQAASSAHSASGQAYRKARIGLWSDIADPIVLAPTDWLLDAETD